MDILTECAHFARENRDFACALAGFILHADPKAETLENVGTFIDNLHGPQSAPYGWKDIAPVCLLMACYSSYRPESVLPGTLEAFFDVEVLL